MRWGRRGRAELGSPQLGPETLDTMMPPRQEVPISGHGEAAWDRTTCWSLLLDMGSSLTAALRLG